MWRNEITKPIALLCSDIHLSHTPPAARSVEPDWYEAQGRMVKQLRKLKKKYDVSIFCAGDVFHKYNPNPELINWAISHLPYMLTIPGQHDMPHHNLEDLDKSAYWTLEVSDILRDRVNVLKDSDISVATFPWGREVKPFLTPDRDEWNKDTIVIALIHSFIYTKGLGYPGAPLEATLAGWKDRLKGYDVAVFGDNHHPFTYMVGDCRVVNCGCLIPRRTQERHIKPTVWLLNDDCSVEPIHLDTSEDKWVEEIETQQDGEPDERLQEFVSELSQLGADSLDFKEAVRRFINDNEIGEEVASLLKEVLNS